MLDNGGVHKAKKHFKKMSAAQLKLALEQLKKMQETVQDVLDNEHDLPKHEPVILRIGYPKPPYPEDFDPWAVEPEEQYEGEWVYLTAEAQLHRERDVSPTTIEETHVSTSTGQKFTVRLTRALRPGVCNGRCYTPSFCDRPQYPSAFSKCGHPRRDDCCSHGPIEGPLDEETTLLVEHNNRYKSPSFGCQ